ncbi:MAG TPA: DUF3857 domain-containing protein, partial [Nitrososphaera sp.]|nr:DUF3857 domain-containing protein [Nitrososphaera sp.]
MRDNHAIRDRAVNLKFLYLVLVAAILAPCPSASATSVPDWLRSAAQQPVKHYADDVNSVELLSDTVANVKDKGEIITRRRVAFKILRPEGIKSSATYGVPFDNETKINYLKGWSITAKGQEYETKDKDTIEVSTSSYEVFSDDKVRAITVPGAEVGTVVGFEYEQKERPYIFQISWSFQLSEPVE